MTFRQRLMYYAIGLILGLVFVAWFFKDRGCAWTPGNRVMANLSHSQIMISDSMRCILKKNGVHDDDIFEIFKTGGVNFDESNTQTMPKSYILEGTKASDKKEFEVRFIVRADTLCEISELRKAKNSGCVGLSSQADRIFTMPERTVQKILKTKEIITSDSLKAVIKKYKLPEGQVINMVQFGKVDFDRSKPMAKPNAIYFLKYNEYDLSVEVAEERAYLLSISKR
ncbi:MAG: hypothetical protein ACHQF2_04360 [Flavobacteriales bacterium]